MIQNFLMMYPFGQKKPHEGPRYGDMYERSMAAMIDLGLVFVVLKDIVFDPLTRFFYAQGDHAIFNAMPQRPTFSEFINAAWDSYMLQLWFLNGLAQLFIIGFFVVGFQITYQTTPGKWLLGLKIMRHNSDEPVSAARYILRFFGYCVACAPLMIGMLWGMFNKQRRGWHDYIAGTVVINTRPHGWYWQKIKQGFRWVWAKLFPARAVENTVAEPTAEQRHEDGDKPV